VYFLSVLSVVLQFTQLADCKFHCLTICYRETTQPDGERDKTFQVNNGISAQSCVPFSAVG